MKKSLYIFLIVIVMFGCSKGATSDVELVGKASGEVFDLKLKEGLVDFKPSSTFRDFAGVNFSVDEYGLLALPIAEESPIEYKPLLNPAIFTAMLNPDAGKSKISTYNIGGFEFSAWLRLTDNIKVEMEGTASKNEPQAAVLSVVWVDGDQNPIGSLLALFFVENAFPDKVNATIKPELKENILLVMNYHDPSIAHLIACRKYNLQAATGMGFVNDEDKDFETNLANNGFFKATIRVGDDVKEDVANGKKNLKAGPSVSVLVNDVEVIKYKNTGSNHSVNPGVWDTPKKIVVEELYLAKTILQIPGNMLNGGHVGFFDDNNGVKEYNRAWKKIVEQSRLTTFGVAMQLGKTVGTQNTHLSPQVGQYDIKKYTTN